MNKGVYKIKCSNEHYYIGSTYNKKGFQYRFYRHLEDLEKNKHCNKALQSIYNKYGKESLTFEIVYIMPDHLTLEQLHNIEQTYINESKNDPLCINMSKKVGGGNHEGLSKYHIYKTDIISMRGLNKSYKFIAKALNEKYNLRCQWMSIRTFFLKHCNGQHTLSKYENHREFILKCRNENIDYPIILKELNNKFPEVGFTKGGIIDFCYRNKLYIKIIKRKKQSAFKPFEKTINALIKMGCSHKEICNKLFDQWGLKRTPLALYFFLRGLN